MVSGLGRHCNAGKPTLSDEHAAKIEERLKGSRNEDFVDRPFWIETAAGTRLVVRLVALRKPEAAIAASVERAKRAAKDKGKAIRAETLLAAEWVILITSLDAGKFPAGEDR